MSPTIRAIYTDGACSGNPGPGGWATVVYFTDGSVHELGGADSQTTNNRMEMQAAIAALEFLSQIQTADAIELHTDSEYLKNGITKWIHGWKKKGWKTASGKPVLNQDLWETLDQLNSTQVKWQYVRGHSGNEGNERCDVIARAFSLGRSPHLKQHSAFTREEPLASDQTPDSPGFAINSSRSDTVQSTSIPPEQSTSSVPMTESQVPVVTDLLEEVPREVPREVRVAQLRYLIETLHVADEIASKGYLITSSELADLMDVNASAVTSRGDNWVWRNWVVSRVRREGNQILWQLERVD